MKNGGEADVHLFSASLIHIIPDSLKGFFFEKRLLFRAVRGYWLCYAMYHDTLIAYAFLKKNYLLSIVYTQEGCFNFPVLCITGI